MSIQRHNVGKRLSEIVVHNGTVYLAGHAGRTVVTVVVGLVAWAVFAFWLHGLLIGVRPFG